MSCTPIWAENSSAVGGAGYADTLYRSQGFRPRPDQLHLYADASWFEPGWQPMTGQILDNSSSVQWLAFCLAQAFDSRKENFAVESGHEPRSKGIKTTTDFRQLLQVGPDMSPAQRG